MDESYEHACLRHWADSSYLLKGGRLGNADHLLGFAGECALKMALGSSSNIPWVHINVLWDRISVHSIPRHFSGLTPLLRTPNPFSDWHVDHRYSQVGVQSRATVDNHRAACRRILGAVGLLGRAAEA